MTLEEKRKREREQRREGIINVATKLFTFNEYDKITMDHIASEAELSRSTLYFHFKDKESLFFAVVNHGIKIFKAMVTEEEKRIQSAGIKGKVLKTVKKRFVIEYPHYSQIYQIFRSGRFDSSIENSMNADAIEVMEYTKKVFKRAILETKISINDRVLGSDVNPVIMTLLSYLIYDSITTEDVVLNEMLEVYGFTLQQFKIEAIDILERLILIS
jgi:TetR/AcrR family transcriptional regulator